MDTDKPKHDHDPQTYVLIGAAMTVHKELGFGFLECVYQEALEVELRDRGIPFVREFPLSIRYKGSPLNAQFKADFICYGEIIVELKAANTNEDTHYAQVINYLRATGLRRGLLLNFASPNLQVRRIVFG